MQQVLNGWGMKSKPARAQMDLSVVAKMRD
jgi:hypothetical protein